MGEPAKYLFDVDFSDPSARLDSATAADLARQITDAEARGHRNGMAAGLAQANAESARRAAIALEQIAASMGAVVARIGSAEERMETEAVEVAIAVARKLCAALMGKEPIAEAMALVADCMRHLVSTPHLVVRVNDAVYEDTKAGVEAIAHRYGFDGRLVILAEPDIASSDCRIEWADGGIVLDRAATDAKISELVDRYIASRRGAETLKAG
jgi:flagellar assembly protein FliH